MVLPPHDVQLSRRVVIGGGRGTQGQPRWCTPKGFQEDPVAALWRGDCQTTSVTSRPKAVAIGAVRNIPNAPRALRPRP
jgi:hypothetical protein